MSKIFPKPTKTALNPDQWVDLYGDYLFNYALGRLRNRTESENAVQETFLAALKGKDSFSGNASERTWLIGILKHKIVDIFRKQYREKPVTDIKKIEQSIDNFFDHANHLKKAPANWHCDPDELLEKKEFWGIFYECLSKLSKTAADAFTLKEIQKMDGHEICKIMNISRSNYWILLHRSRLQLRECLEKNWFETPQTGKKKNLSL